MEDILASIRRIIAEDGPSGEAALKPGDKPSGEGPGDEEVLELTELVEETDQPPVAVLGEDEEPPARRAVPPPLSSPPPSSPSPGPATKPPPLAGPRPGADLLSSRTEAQAGAALGDLVRAVRQQNPPAAPLGRSPLEGLVLEALRPALKAWLDQNLAPLVERVVREEVRRLTRRVEDR